MIIDVLHKATVSLMRASTRAELHETLQSTVTSLGFDSFNLSCGKSDKREFMMDPTISSWDEDDIRRYEQDRWAERDPLLNYAAGDGPVRSWKITDWLNTCDEEYVRYLMEVGLKGGVTAPLTTNPGSLAAMTVLSADKDAFDDQIVRALPLLGNIALMRIDALGVAKCDAALPRSSIKTLSDHQMVILHWAAQGKSNGDIAEIIGQKKRTVDYHMKEIIKKLGVSSKLQAVAIYSCSME